MKKFLLNLSLFTIILFTGFLILLQSVGKNSIKNIENYKFEDKTNKLIAGDSRTQYSINDELVNNSKNISQNSEGLFYTYYKLKILLTNNRHIDTVFLGASFHTFSSYYIEIQKKPDVSGRYFFTLPIEEQISLLTDTKNTLPLIQYALREGIKNQFYNITDTTLLGGYDCYSSPIKINDSLVNERIQFQFYTFSGENELYEENVLYFNKIAELCREMKVALIILNTPMHEKYISKVPLKFINILNELASENKLNVIDFENIALNNNDFLPDGDHLQESGAIITSIHLNDLLYKKINY